MSRFWRDDAGQDIIEYGLLAGIITSALVVILPYVQSSIATAFTGWGTSTNNLWVPGPPST